MRLLDLFCGAGGAAMGYSQAGFTEIVGVDIMPQPNYPFTFVQADAIEFMDAMIDSTEDCGYDLIHASPPCQHFTAYGRKWKDLKTRYGDHLAETRTLLEAAGIPWVIENVPGAPMRVDLELCGSMFGLDSIRRHRWFEVSWESLMLAPPHNHLHPRRFPGHRPGPLAQRPLTTRVAEIGRWSPQGVEGGTPLEQQKRWMGVDWDITLRELSEAIPPAYTEFIGEAFISQHASILGEEK